MGIKEMETELEEEIERTEEKLVQLRQIEAIVNSMQFPAKETVLEKFPNAVPPADKQKYKRRIKYTQFTETETRQVMNMWNAMKDIPNINQQTIISKIANTLKYPRKKVYNKIYWLKRTGHIAVPHGMLVGTIPNTANGRNSVKKSFFYWKEGQKQQLKQLVAQGRTPKEIAEMMGIGIKIVSNKINRMKAYGEIPKNNAVPRNPLLNFK